MFKALLLEKDDAGFRAGVRDVDEARTCPKATSLVAVEYSTLNYKDGLAITDRSPVVRSWPMVAGIDGAGTVRRVDAIPTGRPGDHVVHNGWGVGETHWGCLGERARLKGDWLVRAAAGVHARARRWRSAPPATPRCCACWRSSATASRRATARCSSPARPAASAASRSRCWRGSATGSRRRPARPSEADYLRGSAPPTVIDRAELAAPGKPLQKERWAAVVDAVGSHTLANALAQTRYGGVVAACGLAQGHDLPATVMPFILRGVDARRHRQRDGAAGACARPRGSAWRATSIRPRSTRSREEIALDGAIAKARALIDGKVRGRVVVASAALRRRRRVRAVSGSAATAA